MTEKQQTTGLAVYNPKAVAGSANQIRALVHDPRFLASIKDVAPKHLSPEKLARLAIAAASRKPRLLECTQESLLKSVLEASVLGIDCTGLLGRGYLVPYKNGGLSRQAGHDVYEAQFQPGYLGLCDLARRSGEVTQVYAHAVYAGDEFEQVLGTERRLVHVPCPDPGAVRDESTIERVYAVAVFPNGYTDFRVMTIPEVERHRSRSRAKNNGPWVTDYVAMCLKTVVRLLCKFLPLSPELARALEADDRAEGWTDRPEIIDVEPPGVGESAVDALADRMMGAAADHGDGGPPADPEGEKATREAAEQQKAKLAEAEQQAETEPQAEPDPPAEEPEPEPEPEGEPTAEADSAESSLPQMLKIQFSEFADSKGIAGEQIQGAWITFVKLTTSAYPADCTDEQWAALAERMKSDYDPTQYAVGSAQ